METRELIGLTERANLPREYMVGDVRGPTGHAASSARTRRPAAPNCSPCGSWWTKSWQANGTRRQNERGGGGGGGGKGGPGLMARRPQPAAEDLGTGRFVVPRRVVRQAWSG